MVKPWICLLVCAVAVNSVTAQDYWDSYEEFWSKEALNDDLGVADTSKNDGNIAPIDEEIDSFKELGNADDAVDPNVKDAIDGDGDVVPLDNAADTDNLNDDMKAEDILEGGVPPDDTKENDQAVQAEIEQFRKELDEPEDAAADNFDDYQFEDNRSEAKEEAAPGMIEAVLANDNNRNNEPKDMDQDDYALYDEFGDLPALPAPEEDQIVKDAKNLLEEDNSPFEEDMEENKSQKVDDTGNDAVNENEPNPEDTVLDSAEPVLDKDALFGSIIENKQNEEIDNFLDEAKNNEQNEDTPIENSAVDQLPRMLVLEDDMVDNSADELKDISEEAGNILNVDVLTEKKDDTVADKNVEEMVENNADEMLEDNADDNMDVALENNEKTQSEGDQIVEDEDTVDKVYADLNADLAKLFETWDKLKDNSQEDTDVLEYEEKFGKPFREDVVLSQRDDYDNYDDNVEDVDTNLDDVFADINKPEDDKTGNEEDTKAEDPLDKIKDSNEKEISFENDAFMANALEKKNEEVVDNLENDQAIEDKTAREELDNEQHIEKTKETTSVRTVDVEDLTPEQYDQLMAQFAITHANELDTQREDFGKNIAPVHLTLSAEEAIEVTSPNYPNAYPTNNVVDWILEGDGTGIELNVTDLALRGAQSDYLLIKPGGADASGTDGLVFSFHLNEPRRYRWTDVDRVFVRFVSGTGLSFLTGFHMSVKMIWPPQDEEEKEEPVPEPLLPEPPATLTVNLGGVTVKEFMDLEDQFLRIIADMATMYINANGMEEGLNSTSEVAQITSIRYCNINWQNFEECVEVSFGVPLVHENDTSRLNEDDLITMWQTYVYRDPFAQRLRNMGISIFPIPDDGRVLMAWMVLACGILLSAVLLAFALWRYSCFDSYTRMKSFSDTDSIRDEKRGLDLYPTPHQTLPPLYAENDYKWADSKYEDSARVDMGGFSNRSYVRDELLDIDSDEDVVTPRNGFTTDV